MENDNGQKGGFLRIVPMKRRRFSALFLVLLMAPFSIIAQGTTSDYVEGSMGFNLNFETLPDAWRIGAEDTEAQKAFRKKVVSAFEKKGLVFKEQEGNSVAMATITYFSEGSKNRVRKRAKISSVLIGKAGQPDLIVTFHFDPTDIRKAEYASKPPPPYWKYMLAAATLGLLVMGLRLLPGPTTAPYRIVRELPSGGMASAYEVVVGRGNRAILKKLHSSHAGSDMFIQGMRMECEVLESLRSQGCRQVPELILRGGILAAGQEASTGGDVWFVMSQVKGTRLDNVMPQLRKPEQRARLAEALARAIADVHRSRVAHRDLSPENIIVANPMGARPSVGLIDFGSAIAEGRGHPMDAKIVLKAEYAAPEQFHGLGHAQMPADVYAFGIIVCELFLGRHPFAVKGAVVTGDMHKSFSRSQLVQALCTGGVCQVPGALAKTIAYNLLPVDAESRMDMQEFYSLFVAIRRNGWNGKG